jgi:hypothetical protein
MVRPLRSCASTLKPKVSPVISVSNKVAARCVWLHCEPDTRSGSIAQPCLCERKPLKPSRALSPREIIEEYKGSIALDAGLISSAQAVEHYEIARYGTLKSWAEQLGYTEAVALLDANLQEEIATDELLTQLGEASANPPEGCKEEGRLTH